MSDPITAQSFMAGPAKTISDDFGSTWPATCAACGRDTMEVVRPGKAQCGACDGNGKPITEGVPAPPPVEGETESAFPSPILEKQDASVPTAGGGREEGAGRPTREVAGVPGWRDLQGAASGRAGAAAATVVDHDGLLRGAGRADCGLQLGPHTPGPWKAVECNEACEFPSGVMIAVQRADDDWRKEGCICTMTGQGDGRYDPEVTSANARLIARAPEMAAEIARLREQLADADRTLAGFVKAVREARECIVAIREMADSIDAMPSTAAFAIRETCDRWLNPPLAEPPPARVLTEGGQ